MPRLRRRLFTLLCSLCLILCIFISILWLRSRYFSEVLTWSNARGPRTIYTTRGGLMIDVLLIDWSGQRDQFRPLKYQRDELREPFNYIPDLSVENGDIDVQWQWAAFSWWERRNPRLNRRLIILSTPFWPIALATALLPMAWLTARVRSRHHHQLRLRSPRHPAAKPLPRMRCCP